MPAGLASHPPPDWRRFAFPLVLAALCGTLYLWRLGLCPLKDFDEAYYAEGARKMLARGDLGTPYFNGHPLLLKPILIYWLIALSFRLLGPTEFAARVGSALWSTVVVLLTYWFGARVLGRRAGFLSGLVLAVSYMWVDIARDASIDALLAAALTPAAFLVFLAAHASPPKKGRLYLAAYALFGVALLAKGPVPVGVVLAGLLAYSAAAGRLRATLAEARLLSGFAVTLAVAAPWYIYELGRHPSFFATFFLGEHLGHIHGELARTGPVWHNLSYLLIYFFPWVAFLPAAFAHAFHQQDRGHVLRLAAWWSLTVVVLFSLPRSKLAHYLAPAFPALALLVGAWLDQWLARGPVSRVWTAVGFAGLGLGAAASAAAAVVAVVMPTWMRTLLARQFGDWRPGWSPVVTLSALALGAGAVLAAARWRRGALMPALAGAMVVATVAHVGWFLPRRAEIQAQPRKELALLLARALPRWEPVGVYYAKRNATVFYLGRPIVDLGEREEELPGVVRFLSSPTPVALLTHRKFLARLRQSLPRTSVRAERGDFLVLSNRSKSVDPGGAPG